MPEKSPDQRHSEHVQLGFCNFDFFFGPAEKLAGAFSIAVF
jgi:hypothetical protein